MNDTPGKAEQCASAPPKKRWSRRRRWFQAGFLAVWLAPLGQWLHGVPACVFHCYSCPLSSFGCPVGLLANYAAVFPVWHEVPCLLIGVLVLVGGLSGSLACGWACPFGFLQDGLAKISRVKVPLPNWLGHVRYAVLIGLVLLLPYYLGSEGILFDDQSVSICRLCPAGALESGVPYSVQSVLDGKGWLMSWFKMGILGAFLVAAVFTYRPWCKVLCPLGGMLALFNRWSMFHLRFKSSACVECNLCRSRCVHGMHVDKELNSSGCIRCLECTNCGAIEPIFALPGANDTPGQVASRPKQG